MPSRREMMLATMLAVGGGAALFVRLDREENENAIPDLDRHIPARIAGWTKLPAENVIMPPADNLSAYVYENVVTRRYVAEGERPITLVAAYASAQTYATQLHRPEICYPASGFRILDRQFSDIAIGRRQLPVGVLTARRDNRTDTILYWTRLGAEYPQSVWEQRWDIAKRAFTSTALDGIIVRLSQTTAGYPSDDEAMRVFARQLHRSLPMDARGFVFGSLI